MTRTSYAGNLDSIVSYSSCLIAASRALESERPDALVVDPLAMILAGEKAISEKRRSSSGDKDTTWRIAIRTKYFDTVIVDFFASHHAAQKLQVVHLGAGMDSRAYRLDAPDGAIFYEVDNIDVLELKTRLLAGAVSNPKTTAKIRDMIRRGNQRKRSIGTNMEFDDWKTKLLRVGFVEAIPTCWVLEGLTYYLQDDATVHQLFGIMRQLSASGSRLVVSVASKASVARAKASTNELMQSWSWGNDEPQNFISNSGWTCHMEDVVALGEKQANYGRFPQSQAMEAIGRETGRTSGIMYVTAKC